MLSLLILVTHPLSPSAQRWFVRLRYLGVFRQLKYFVKDHIIRKPYKVVRFNGEFQQELLHAIPFAYWHYRNGTLLKTISSEYTKDLYFFSKYHEEDNSIVRSPTGNENLEIPNAPHDSKLVMYKWLKVPFIEFYKNDLFKFEKEPLIIANRYNTEWGHAPISFFDLDDLDQIISQLGRYYQIIYNRPPVSRISNDKSIVLELNDDEWLRRNHPNVIILSDLESSLPLVNSYNHLQLLVYANCRKFISTHGGTATLASMFGGINLIYSKKGYEHLLGEFQNVFPKLSGCNVHVFTDKRYLIDRSRIIFEGAASNYDFGIRN